jgi:hypothetical protein
LQGFVKNEVFLGSVYCYSIESLPLDDGFEFSSGRRLNIYSPSGVLQISETNGMSCSVDWDKKVRWQAAIEAFDNEVEPESRRLALDIPIPDYTKLDA